MEAREAGRVSYTGLVCVSCNGVRRWVKNHRCCVCYVPKEKKIVDDGDGWDVVVMSEDAKARMMMRNVRYKDEERVRM